MYTYTHTHTHTHTHTDIWRTSWSATAGTCSCSASFSSCTLATRPGSTDRLARCCFAARRSLVASANSADCSCVRSLPSRASAAASAASALRKSSRSADSPPLERRSLASAACRPCCSDASDRRVAAARLAMRSSSLAASASGEPQPAPDERRRRLGLSSSSSSVAISALRCAELSCCCSASTCVRAGVRRYGVQTRRHESVCICAYEQHAARRHQAFGAELSCCWWRASTSRWLAASSSCSSLVRASNSCACVCVCV